jgi:hypothetical protein
VGAAVGLVDVGAGDVLRAEESLKAF